MDVNVEHHINICLEKSSCVYTQRSYTYFLVEDIKKRFRRKVLLR